MFRKYKRKISKDGEAGFTMVELLLVIVLTSILGVFGFQILTQCLLVQRDMQVRKEHSDDGVLAMNQISRELREAKGTSILPSTDTLEFRKVEPLPSFGYYVFYGRRSGTNQLVRLSIPSTDNDGNDHGTVTSMFSSNMGDVVAENVSAFTADAFGNISIQFTGEANSRQTRVFVRN
jgi:prepilin-type N-terminal cleavage/methylation domain-containing protein